MRFSPDRLTGGDAALAHAPALREAPLRVLWRLYRVGDWLHFLPLPLVGWIAEGSREPLALAGGVLALAFSFAYASALNHAFDHAVDARSPGKNPVGTSLGRGPAIALSLPVLVGALAATLAAVPGALLPCAIVLAASTVYSAPPRLKRLPVIGAACNLAIGVPALFYAGQPDWASPVVQSFAALFSVLLFVSQLLHEAADRDDDAAAGVATVATWLGVRATVLASAALLPALPLLAFALSSEAQRTAATLFCALFAGAWMLVFAAGSRAGRELRPERLRFLRLAYRYTALVLGLCLWIAAT